ncbi:MAG: NAD(+) diphosphatase [Rhizobiaceae bacterium]|nr:NAD(+) diphosphatase [Rhizobiaceae bacterium]
MSSVFDDCAVPEPSSLLGFSSNGIASDVESRTDSCLSAALDNKDTLYLAVKSGSVLICETQAGSRAFLSLEEINKFDPDFVNAIMPGIADGRSIVAVPAKIDVETLKTPYRAMDARAVLYSASLPPEEAGAVGMALSLLHWHKTNQHCGLCGSASRSHLGGLRRDCKQCKAQIFPRTDPVVIMLALRGDKCLLGRGPQFPPNWYSCLAGFVEPGETIEQAVRRETREESGIKIGRVKYYASQPWPFPHSLMIGAYCEALSDEISFDGEELEDCRWFDREEVLAMIERRHAKELRAPPSKSIAAHIMGNWLKQTA